MTTKIAGKSPNVKLRPFLYTYNNINKITTYLEVPLKDISKSKKLPPKTKSIFRSFVIKIKKLSHNYVIKVGNPLSANLLAMEKERI